MTQTNSDTDLTAMKLHGTTDASVWTNEFDRIYPDSRPDWATMFGWFANAIEVGRMFGVRETLTPTDPLREALDALDRILADSESQHPGGWGPDVTTVADLRIARDDILAALGDPA